MTFVVVYSYHRVNGKYTNALPLERQSKAFKTNGIQLSKNTMAN
ncbi:hypothetical protein DWW77_05270 [Ruminococcus sp. AF17-12]|nr:hypothetical protein DWW77_05270 [Ruminococcus sp. AF17-12]